MGERNTSGDRLRISEPNILCFRKGGNVIVHSAPSAKTFSEELISDSNNLLRFKGGWLI